jgi:hypothetical protein
VIVLGPVECPDGCGQLEVFAADDDLGGEVACVFRDTAGCWHCWGWGCDPEGSCVHTAAALAVAGRWPVPGPIGGGNHGDKWR